MASLGDVWLEVKCRENRINEENRTIFLKNDGNRRLVRSEIKP